MKPTTIIKCTTDLAMTILLMLLMAFELVGRTAHEWLGAALFLLFILHHVLNRQWIRNLTKGRYTPFRTLQTISAVLVLLSMLASLLSAVLISRYVFAFLPINGGASFGRTLHMLSAYWGFLFLSLHLGLNWTVMMGIAKKLLPKLPRFCTILARLAAFCIAVYGIYALFRRDLPDYLFLRSHFVFFDYEEPRLFFFLDYLAIMGLFICIGYLCGKGAQQIKPGSSRR